MAWATVEQMNPSTEPDRDLFGRVPSKHADWSHRRGEPRIFALVWMGYLMAMTALMFASMSGAFSISHAITRPAARSMLVATMLGVAVVWPMIRLSQLVPYERTVACALRDWVVVMIPVQAVVLPQMFPVLAGWPVGVVLAIDAFMGVWALMIAGLIAMAHRSIGYANGQSLGRGAWMVVVLVVVLGAPVYGMLTATGAHLGIESPRVGWLLSPVAGVLELTRDRSASGQSAAVQPGHWRMILAVGCVGMALLLFGYASEVARRRNRG